MESARRYLDTHFGVTEDGKVWRDTSGVWVETRGHHDRFGYHMVTINRRPFAVHRMVATAFHGAPGPKQVCRHLDGNPSNNAAANLAWGTQSENLQDYVRHRREGKASTTSKVPDLKIVSLKAGADRADDWNRAAAEAGMTRHAWCMRMLDIAAGG